MNIYIIELHFNDGTNITMPYYFTNMKEACLYGEYEYRKYTELTSYKIEKLIKVDYFYKLK